MCHFHFLYGNTAASLLPVSAKSLFLSWNCSFAIRGIPGSLSLTSLFSVSLFPFFVLWELRAEPVRCFSSEALCIDSLWGGGRLPPTASFLLGSDCRLTVLKEHEGVSEGDKNRKRESERERERERGRYLNWEKTEVIYSEVTRTPLISGFTCELLETLMANKDCGF